MFTLLVDDNLHLALINYQVQDELFELVSQQKEYLGQWLAFPAKTNKKSDTAHFIQASLHDYADEKSCICTLWHQGKFAGVVGFNEINHSLKKVKLGYWLSQELQGKGIMSRAVSKLISLAFEQFDMEKVEISAAVNNQPSRKLCENIGCTLEGIISRAENINGQILDHAVYGLSRADWRNDLKSFAIKK